MKISIVVPCYNAARTLPDTLRSLTAQTHTNLEIICIDDGSTDTTRNEILRAASRDARIRLFDNIGKGPSTARNLGASTLARGEVVAFCDADDIWTEDKLAQVASAMADPAVEGVYGQIAFFTETPADARVCSTVPGDDLSIDMLLGENPVCTMSNIAVRARVFETCGGFDPALVHNEDLEWLIRIVGMGARIIGLDSLQVFYRTTPTGLSADLEAMAAGRAQALRTAARFDHHATPAADAIHNRYLARRALRLGQARGVALRFALTGVWTSPRGFFSAPARGVLTLLGALGAVFMPKRLSHALFSR